MLELNRLTAALVCLTAAAAACSCGDDTTSTGGGGSSPTSSSSSTGGAGSTGGTGGTGGDSPGGSGGGVPCLENEGTVFALTQLTFGEGTNGQWRAIGRNLDGLESDENSTDVCQPNAGGTASVAYPDGDDGIDNSFGKNMLPVILSLSTQWPTAVNNSLDQGNFNAMLKAYCLPDSGDAQITTKVFGGADLGAIPMFDGTDVWPVAPELLGDLSDPESSTLVFENSSVTADVFDSGPDESFILTIPITYNDQTASLKLTLHSAQLTMDLSNDRKSATGGVLGGVLNTEELVDQVKKVAFMADICEDASYPAILQTIRQMSDIMTDGTQDPSQTCDGISFGVHFEMVEVQLGNVALPAPVGMACP